MKILAAIKREQKKLEKQLGKLQHQLSGVRAAAEALGHWTRSRFSHGPRAPWWHLIHSMRENCSLQYDFRT